MERPFSAAKGFNTNLVQYVLLHHIVISNVLVCFFMSTISHVHGRTPTSVLYAQNLVCEKV